MTNESKKKLTMAQCRAVIKKRTKVLKEVSGQGLIKFLEKDRTQLHRIGTRHSSALITKMLRDELGVIINQRTLKEINDELLMESMISSNIVETHVRAVQTKDKIVIDPCTEDWEYYVISEGKVSIEQNVNEVLIRPNGIKALPKIKDSDVADVYKLKKYLNFKEEDQFTLFITALAFAYCTRSPDIIMMFTGPEGCGKSTASEIAKRTIDPEFPMKLNLTTEADLYLQATSSLLLVCDNISGISGKMSDSLCRLATGTGQKKRQLYSDYDSSSKEVKNPLVLNGIDDMSSRTDLLSRSILLELTPFIETKSSNKLYADFEEDHPSILKGILEMIASALIEMPNIEMENPPRMFDYAQFGVASEKYLKLESGSFLKAYKFNIAYCMEKIGTSSELISTIVNQLQYIEDGILFKSASDLLSMLNENSKNSKLLPQSPIGLGKSLRRLESVFKKLGIEITFKKMNDRLRTRMIEIKDVEANSSYLSTGSRTDTDFERAAVDHFLIEDSDTDGLIDDKLSIDW